MVEIEWSSIAQNDLNKHDYLDGKAFSKARIYFFVINSARELFSLIIFNTICVLVRST